MRLTPFIMAGTLATVLVGVSGIARSGDPGKGGLKGPCEEPAPQYGAPGPCEEGCTLWCTDPCSVIIYSDAECPDEEGYCNRKNENLPNFMCLECTCPFGGGECIPEGEYKSDPFNNFHLVCSI